MANLYYAHEDVLAIRVAKLGLEHLEPAKTRVNIKAAHAQMQILHSRLELHYFSILVQVR